MKIFSFYLPQYHTVKENDEWWGEGFTEWTNVVKENPRFKGHFQPQLPANMGFYDLRVKETRIKQSKLAEENGIDGFIHYHYWFHGTRILEQPLKLKLENEDEDFPFALCWANESWTRAWDGMERDMLMEQKYSDEDDDNHIDFLMGIFSKPSYIKINGKPLFLIYRLGNHPNPEKFIIKLREASLAKGFSGVYLSGVKSSFSAEINEKILSLDIDAFVDFQPNSDDFPDFKTSKTKVLDLLKKKLPNFIYQYLKTKGSANKLINYNALVVKKSDQTLSYHKRVLPCIFPSWDNSPRRATATIIQNTNPLIFEKWLTSSVKHVENYPKEEQMVFINAWNEWAEGCHLEPDTKNGKQFLECVKKIKEESL
jgi:lipopolysaccharide biosynthesis protein